MCLAVLCLDTRHSQGLLHLPHIHLVSVQLVLERGSSNGLLASDATGGAPHHVAHIHDGRNQLLAALGVRCLLAGGGGVVSGGTGGPAAGPVRCLLRQNDHHFLGAGAVAALAVHTSGDELRHCRRTLLRHPYGAEAAAGGGLSGDQFPQHDAQAVDVHLLAAPRPQQHLWCRPREGTNTLKTADVILLQDLSQPHVSDLRHELTPQQHIGALQVEVHHLMAVEEMQAACNVQGDLASQPGLPPARRIFAVPEQPASRVFANGTE
mmetsp:Transcript_8239/g.24577  ORF Transcript_8239/g.24577 Transcript_8239/m.24577 type:complete len:265 (-) Transcript_8239:333-1127(-)